MTVHIMVVDDHAIVQEGLCSLIEELPDYTVTSKAANGREAIDMACREQPDIIIMDLSMPEMNGIDATSQILKEIPSCKVIILSMYSDKRYIIGSFQAGASGYLLKECAFNELQRALDAVRCGQTYLSPSIAATVIHDYRHRLITEATEEELTTKEREVLQLLAEGYSAREIADKLFVSVKAVESRKRKINQKLGISNLAGLVKYAIREGLTEL